MARDFPRLRVAGVEAPPWLPSEPRVDPVATRRIRESGARLLFVGLRCPKQEFWMAEHSQALGLVQVGVGAAFDFVAGTKTRAPMWMQQSGFEWLFRLCVEPRRLWKRYLFTNLAFLATSTRRRGRRGQSL